MCLEIFSNDNCLQTYSNVNEEKILFATEITLPTCLQFKVSGKNHNKDTLLDAEGKIIADKYIILKNLSLGLIPINTNLLFSICSNNNTFWSTNETISINFDESDFILWHMKKQNKFSFSR